jgi:hypothetical protein
MAGNSRAIKTLMIVMTTNNSTRVKARLTGAGIGFPPEQPILAEIPPSAQG